MNLRNSGGAPCERERTRTRFDSATIVMHWCSLVLLIAIFGLSSALHHAADSATADALLAAHRRAGLLLWLLTLTRLCWRATYARPAELPPTIGRFQAGAARATQAGLLVLLLLQPVTGLLHSLLHGVPVLLLGFTAPSLFGRHHTLAKALLGAHEIGAWALLALVGLHAAAALFHHFVVKDGVLRAILPWESRRALQPREVRA